MPARPAPGAGIRDVAAVAEYHFPLAMVSEIQDRWCFERGFVLLDDRIKLREEGRDGGGGKGVMEGSF